MGSKGITLTDNTILEMEQCLVKAEADDIHTQSTCIEVIWLLYLGNLPSEKVVKWYESQEGSHGTTGWIGPD